MAFGLQTFNASGTLMLDVSTRLTRIIDFFEVGSTDSGNYDYSAAGFSAANGAAFACRAAGALGVYMPHTVTISGSTVYWAPAGTSPTGSLIYVIMYK